MADAFGLRVVRYNLGRDLERVAILSSGLTAKLDEVWSAERVMPLDMGRLVQSLESSALDLLSCTDLYLSGKNIAEKPVRLAVGAFIEVAGNRDVQTYQRTETRQLVATLLAGGGKAATVRRRVQSLHAVLEFGFLEQDLDKRNPFARLAINGENKDAKKRGVFAEDQLQGFYKACLTASKYTRLILPILGETGARLAEIVGMRWGDVCLGSGLI
ncbi:hypothetical protein BV392_19200, partial [Rhodovulum sulfidophilum]